jgi:hypothetical protein
MEETEHTEIYEEMMAHHNVKHSDNAASDARINFQAAQIALLQKNGPKPRANPLDKNKGKEAKNLGGGTDTEADTKSIRLPKLDEYAADFVKRTGMKDEQVARALEGDAPVSLFGKKI